MLRMGFALICLLGFMIFEAWAESLDCLGVHRYNARGTAYYPADDPVQGGFFDMRGKPLNTLQVNYDVSFEIQSTLVISKSKGPSKTVRDIRTSTYQICSIEDKTISTTNFYK